MNNIPAEEIKRNNPIEQVVGRVVALHKKAGGLMGCCPFHEEHTPSFIVYSNTQRYKCFGCGASGDVIDFISATNNVPFQEAIKILQGNRFEITVKPIPVSKPKEITSRYREAYEEIFMLPDETYGERCSALGISVQSWKSLGAAWSLKKDAWMLPFRDSNCKIIGFQFRSSSGFKWTMEHSHLGLFIPRVKVQEEVYIAEGASDCAALLTLGVYAIARPAAFACHDMLTEFIKSQKIKRAVIVCDFDPKIDTKKSAVKSPGIDSALKLKLKLPCDTKIVIPPNGAKDIRQALQAGLDRKTFLGVVNSV